MADNFINRVLQFSWLRLFFAFHLKQALAETDNFQTPEQIEHMALLIFHPFVQVFYESGITSNFPDQLVYVIPVG